MGGYRKPILCSLAKHKTIVKMMWDYDEWDYPPTRKAIAFQVELDHSTVTWHARGECNCVSEPEYKQIKPYVQGTAHLYSPRRNRRSMSHRRFVSLQGLCYVQV